MTPLPSSPAPPSCGWTRRPASSSGIPSSHATRSREGLIRAWRDLSKLRDPDGFDAWLHRLTVNSCIDQTRRRRRRPIEVELTVIHAPAISDMSGALADRDQVDEVLSHLDERTRAVVVLHYFLGMPLTEVAATLGIPVGTVKSRLHRALGEMRVAIAADPVMTIPSPVSGGQLA
jgi:RNA polymerase sigma factor (sigma-70 family)